MKRIELKKLGLLNFKGARNVEVCFEGDTTISGDNGVGKSTLFDAFVWLLFGKNAEDKKDFSIKTYDSDGNIIPRIPHEVSAVITIDGTELMLRRCFNEKWTKKRGSAVEEFTGHEEERFWNEVPCSLKEWNAKIAELIPEQTFKMITNPRYFTSMKPELQRATLLAMSGEVKEMDIVGGDPDFINLLQNLQGKTLEEYKRQIASKKSLIKAEIKAIPERIDERKRDLTENLDEAELNNAAISLRQREESVEAVLLHNSKALEQYNEQRAEANRKVTHISTMIAEREREIMSEANREFMAQQKQIMNLQNEISTSAYNIEKLTSSLAEYKQDKSLMEVDINELRERYKQICAETLTLSDDDFICPACHRPFEVSEIERIQSEMTEFFNTNKVGRLNRLNEQGAGMTRRLSHLEQSIKETTKAIETTTNKRTMLQNQLDGIKPMTESNADVYINVDVRLRDLRELLSKAKAEYDAIPTTVNEEESTKTQAILQDVRKQLADVNAQLAKIQRNKEIEARCEQLAEELRSNSEELARLEGIEYTIARYQKRRIDLVEGKINNLFRKVRWKLYDTQINGGEVECCIPMVDGTPYADANKTSQLHAGLDIIRTISSKEGITAPIFIDNAESFNTLPEMDAQIIRLVVSHDKQLTIQK